MPSRSNKTEWVSIRLTAEKKARIEALIARLPYRTTMSSLVERGLDMASAEAERLVQKIEERV